MFETFITQPIYNILVAIYGYLPGHDLGITIVLFTILVRLALWPLMSRQLHQSRKMREIQPELKKVKAAAAGDKQKEAAMMMELYKERGISPFGTIGLTLVQLPILFGVFYAVRQLTQNVDKISSFTYELVRHIPFIEQIITKQAEINFTSLGFIDLHQKAYDNGAIHWPILVIAIIATVVQYFQSKQIMPQAKDKKSLRDILRSSATTGQQPAQEDMSSAMGGIMLYMMPLFTIMFALYAPGAMVVYLLTSSLMGIIQQTLIFRQSSDEMEAEVVSVKSKPIVEKPSEEVKIKKGKITTKTKIITNNISTPKSKKKRRR